MIRVVRTILFIVLFSLTSVHVAIGGWTLVKTFGIPVGCGYFFDKNNGMVGLGNYNQWGQLSIYTTSDGGVSWSRATTPGGGTGWISSIHMINKTEGYASIFSDDFTVWKTIDGGKNWTDRSGKKNANATCIYATSKAVIQSFWRMGFAGNVSGGRSLDEGTTVKQIFASGRYHESNGIDFTDDLHGVVLMGPCDRNALNCWITVDGGVNWTPGGNLRESWGVYALKGTQTYFALPEGFSQGRNQAVYRSNDWGRTWSSIFTFITAYSFTGHISGSANHLYVQTTGDGLFRSDDLGSSWKSVGGPDNSRDTRFVVTGCVGETVYAFNNSGEVWKTTDGGDGTLTTAPEPYIGVIRSAQVGDSVTIPIYLKATRDSFSIKHFAFHLSYDGDILTPTQEAFVTYNSLSASATAISRGEPESNGIFIMVDLPRPVTQDSDLSKPLISLQMGVTLSRYLSCPVRLDTFSVSNSAPFPLCTIPLSEFVVDPLCGDKSLSEFMFNGKIPSFLSVYPNPASSADIEVVVLLPEKTVISLDVTDALGKIIANEVIHGQYAKGSHTLKIGTSSLTEGIYYLRLRTDSGSYSTARVVISR